MSDLETSLRAAADRHRAGDLLAAEAGYRAILDDHPAEARVWNMLGQVYTQRQLHDRAAEAIAKAVELDPEQFVYHYFLGHSLRRLGKLEPATEAFAGAARLRPDHLESHWHHIQCLERLHRDTAPARAALEAALPANAAEAKRLAAAAQRSRRHRDALLLLERATALDPSDAAAWHALAAAREQYKELAAALEAEQQAIALDPSLEGAAARIVSLCERLNKLEDARWYAGAALERDAGDPDLNLALAKIDRRDSNLPAARQRLEALTRSERISSKWTFGNILVELGHTLDAMGDYDNAFACFTRGQQVLSERSQVQSIPMHDYPAWIQSVQSKITPDRVAGWQDPSNLDPAAAPIFFVGFPRSGTTLLERMLDAHPNLVATDEAGLLPDLMNKAKASLGDRILYPENLDLLTDEQIQSLRAAYLEDARALLGPDLAEGKRIVDKLPLNITRLAAVRRIFPDAKVLVAIRDPRDVVLSAFFQVLAPNHAMVHFHRLDTTAHAYALVMNLYLRQRDTLGLDLVESRYEDLVADPETQARRVVEALGEDWSDEVMNYRDKAAGQQINTPSYQAVTQQTHSRAVARWRHYARHLDPVLPILQPFVEEFGYER